LQDLITGAARAVEVVDGYEKAWADYGRLDADGHDNMMLFEDSRKVRPNESAAPWVDAWCGALMNMWNRDFVRKNYPGQIGRFVTPGEGGSFSVISPPPGPAIVDTCDFGWVTAWTSEMGDAERRDGLLAHADRYMSPTWLNGGLYYPRNDTVSDEDGHRVEIEPMTGNVQLGYARLNVSDGLWGLYNQPWSSEHFEEPALTAVERDIDVSRAVVVDGVLRTRLRRRTDLPGIRGEGTVTISRVVRGGRWRLTMDGTGIAEIDGVTVLQSDSVPPGTVSVGAQDGLVLRCPDGEPRSFELARVS
jgi:hypothetical protein